MRFRAFPVSVEIDGVLVEPALMWATDEKVEVWTAGATRDEKVLRASYPGAVSKERARGEWVAGRRALFAVELVGGERLLAGKSPGCGCGNPMKNWSPPQGVEV